MNIAGIINDATAGYDGVAVEIYVSGCCRGCPGCHNPEMQDFDYGEPLVVPKLIQYLYDRQEWFDIISILGGDILCSPDGQAKNLLEIIHMVFPEKSLWLFTGAEISEIPQWCFIIFDVIKYGRYIEELKQSEGLATSNQGYIRKGVDY
jgi:anaerobic ribonucleoside-triphosphate reductase activating protein